MGFAVSQPTLVRVRVHAYTVLCRAVPNEQCVE